MNPKDYKAIAEIIKAHMNSSYAIETGTASGIADRLADYFEKEVLLHREESHKRNNIMGCPENCWCWDFNREQFLKDCGVDKK